MSLSRQELHDLAAAGAAAKVKEMEQQLATLHKEWPELFLSKTPPQLLAATLKATSANGNGHWPAVLASEAGGVAARVAAREQQLLAFVAQHPTGVTPTVISQSLHIDLTTTTRTTAKLLRAKQLRRASRGLYVTTGAPASTTTSTPEPTSRKRVVWTDAMRAAAAKRMRKRHRDPAFQKALANGRRKKERK